MVLALFSTLAKQKHFGGNIQVSLLSGQLHEMDIDHELMALIMRPGDEEQNRATIEQFVDLMSDWKPESIVLYALWVPWLADRLRERAGSAVMTLDPAQPGDIPPALRKLGPQMAVKAALAGARSMRAARKVLGAQGSADAYNPNFNYRFLGTDEPVEQDLAFISLLSCPFDAPIAGNPAFRGLEIDPEVSRRGCSYCNGALDYRPMPDGRKERLLIRQIRHLQDHLPALGEIALPFPEDYLVPLARIVRASGSNRVRPIVMSGQFRSESILEHEQEIDDLLTAVEETGFEFHMNVVGLESFVDDDLRLYNRGTSRGVRDALEAIRRLRADHDPAAFMPTTTGSFILFHPWQTLEGLRKNVEAMRREGVVGIFDSINLNEIRFHPGVPLYHLARRDGLLTPVRRHSVQDVPLGGYFSESPWRFAHDDTAHVHHLFSMLSNRTEDRLGLLTACLRQAVERGSMPEPQDAARGLEDLTRLMRARPAPGCTRHVVGVGSATNVGYARDLFDGRRFSGSPEAAMREIERVGPRENHRLTIGGPEPTLLEWLPAMIRGIKDTLAVEVDLLTYGRMLTYPWYVAKLVAAGTDVVSLILHHPEPDGHDEAVRVPGAFRQASGGLRALAGLGRRTAVAAVVGPENRGRLGDMARLARDLGASEFHLVLPLGNLDLDGLGTHARESARALDLASSLGLGSGFDVELSFRWPISVD
ncbi:MAG: hypothetical protein JRG91_03215 [Deltaproteobacteria bacterium]|nr:hypothetical protein [Deltaproteobacteria bacterium]